MTALPKRPEPHPHVTVSVNQPVEPSRRPLAPETSSHKRAFNPSVSTLVAESLRRSASNLNQAAQNINQPVDKDRLHDLAAEISSLKHAFNPLASADEDAHAQLAALAQTFRGHKNDQQFIAELLKCCHDSAFLSFSLSAQQKVNHFLERAGRISHFLSRLYSAPRDESQVAIVKDALQLGSAQSQSYFLDDLLTNHSWIESYCEILRSNWGSRSIFYNEFVYRYPALSAAALMNGPHWEGFVEIASKDKRADIYLAEMPDPEHSLAELANSHNFDGVGYYVRALRRLVECASPNAQPWQSRQILEGIRKFQSSLMLFGKVVRNNAIYNFLKSMRPDVYRSLKELKAYLRDRATRAAGGRTG